MRIQNPARGREAALAAAIAIDSADAAVADGAGGGGESAGIAAAAPALAALAARMLAPGGTLVYCTCSLEPQEGVGQIERVLAGGAPVRRRPVDAAEIGDLGECLTGDGDLRTLPCHLGEIDGLDGFFAARLVRTT